MFKSSKNRKISISMFLFNFIVFAIFGYFILFVYKNNPQIKSVLKGFMMFFIFVSAFINYIFFSKNKKINIYKVWILIGILFSLISDIVIEFNFILGGVASLFSLLSFFVSFLYYFSSLKRNIFFEKLKRIDFLYSFLISLLLFSFFIIISLIFVFPKMAEGMFVLNLSFPIYMFIFSLVVGSSFLLKTRSLLKLAIVLFFLSDVILFFNVASGFSYLFSFFGLFIYFSSENIFALEIND